MGTITVNSHDESRYVSNQSIYWILGALLVVALVVFFVRRTGTMDVPTNPATSAPMEPADQGPSVFNSNAVLGTDNGIPLSLPPVRLMPPPNSTLRKLYETNPTQMMTPVHPVESTPTGE